ncbi:hypothetical protein [Mesoplasma melaleucae]|uniref:hypothetical protein n=1 Tax=Mesoplasma melaleucae TaxID=81459 RepID=UPI0004808206|nr:hypothetical protein [Mesoplasma melaleucae]
MLIATICGVVSAQFITSYMGGGTIATLSPGSIIALIALSPGLDAILINLLAYLLLEQEFHLVLRVHYY